MANEVAEKKQTFSVALMEELNKVESALPQDFNKTRFVQNCLALMNDTPQLAEYVKNYGSIPMIAGLMLGAYQGLDFFNKECYLIPRGSKLDFQKDYKGVVKLIKKYSIEPVEDVYAKLIREGDFFEEEIINGKPTVNFKPKFLNNNEIIGVFAVCLFKNGTLKYDVMSKADIEACRKVSKMPNGNSWKNFYGEMAKKSVIHRLKKMVPLEFENPKQAELFIDEDMAIATTEEKMQNDVEAEQNTEEFIDVDAVEVIEDLPPFMQEDN